MLRRSTIAEDTQQEFQDLVDLLIGLHDLDEDEDDEDITGKADRLAALCVCVKCREGGKLAAVRDDFLQQREQLLSKDMSRLESREPNQCGRAPAEEEGQAPESGGSARTFGREPSMASRSSEWETIIREFTYTGL